MLDKAVIVCTIAVTNRTYPVVGFGEAKPPRDLLFLFVVGGFAANYEQKRRFLGGLAALQTSLRE